MKTNNRFRKTKITFVLVGLVTAIVLTSAGSGRAATWTQKADMPTARMGLSTSVVDGKIYAISSLKGLGVKKVEEYDPATDTWTEKADMPTARVFVATSVVDGKIYAIGGATYWRGTALATVEEYDPATDTWTSITNMPEPRYGLATSAVDGKIYAIGGETSQGAPVLATVEEYDPATDTWTKKADMPTARVLVSTNVVNGKIYAIGGQTLTAWPTFSTVEEYDPATDTWTKKGDMPAPRVLSTCVVDDKIYGFGGRARRGGAPLSTVFQYDPATDTWTALDDMPVFNGGLGTSAVGGKIYIIGGSSAPYPFNSVLSTVWEYDTGLTISSPDFNGDGIVDIKDLLRLIQSWDLDDPMVDIAPLLFGDGVVDTLDLELLMSNWGQPVDDPTLIAHWPLDEAQGDIAYDRAGLNDAFLIGGPLWQPAGGQVNGAIQLDGVDDFITTMPVLNPSVGPFSVLAWVKGGVPGQTVISQVDGTDWLGTDPLDGALMTELRGTGRGATILTSQTIITDSDWHRIGFVWDGSHRALYVDDVAVAEDTQTDLGASENGLYIGTGKAMEPGSFWFGLIDDVRIYNRVVIP